jgi:hypothetical protein
VIGNWVALTVALAVIAVIAAAFCAVRPAKDLQVPAVRGEEPEEELVVVPRARGPPRA